MRLRQTITGCVLGAVLALAAGCSNDSPSVGDSAVEPSGSAATRDTTSPAPADTISTGTISTGTISTGTISTGTTSTGTISGDTTPAVALGDPVVSFNEIDGFNQPVGISWRPTDGTIYVVEQDGRVVIMSDGQADAVALDMTDLTGADGERGLLGLELNADGTLAYVNYTNNSGDTRIDEYAVAADGTFDAATRREVLGFDQPYPNHNGGDLAFGPDNMLYIGTGDGGSGGDPDRRSLDLGEWLGKMLRIDPRPSGDAGYTVPADNPFVEVEGARPEIWSIGLRNPWRFSFDRATGDLWIADVGQNVWEEVDVAWAADGGGRGVNFGWSALEGTHPFNSDQSADGATPPIYEYPHGDAGCSISGGVRYRGAAIPALVGWYVYGDYCANHVRALQIEGTAVVNELVMGEASTVSAVAEGPGGELFVLSLDGPIYAVTQG